MSYKKYKWEITSQDINSPFIRNYIWTSAFFKYPKLFKINRLIVGIISQGVKMNYLFDSSSWNHCHEQLKKKVFLDNQYIEKLIDRTNRLGEDFNRWTEKNIYNQNLDKLTTAKIIKLYKIFADKQSTLYAMGVVLPVLDFQNLSFVENGLKEFLSHRVSLVEYSKYFSAFTEPVFNSFSRDQEENLLKIMARYENDRQWARAVADKSAQQLAVLYPKFWQELTRHTKKFCWVYYVYAGPAFTEENFLDFIKDYLHRGIKATQYLKQLKDKKSELRKNKVKYIKQLKPNQYELSILNLAGKMVWAKPRRKDYQSCSYFHLEKLQRHIGKLLHLSLVQVRSLPIKILEKCLKAGEVDKSSLKLINEIAKSHVCLPNDDGTVAILSGKEAVNFEKKYLRTVKDENDRVSFLGELIGNCAYAGEAKGIVKIVNIVDDMKKMKYGDVLVSAATTPAIVTAMKKAAAIVTDEGGLTCHAAIVSRELGIPCVIGTKIATKVLKDGDMVEADAEKGMVKKVS